MLLFFFKTITESEACATCLLLACSEENRGTDIALWASQAFMLYGGEPYYHFLQNPNQPGNAMQRSIKMNQSTIASAFPDRSAPIYMSTPMSYKNLSPQANLTNQTSPTINYPYSPSKIHCIFH